MQSTDLSQAKIIANGLDNISIWLKYLGNGDAATEMGAIEHLSVCVKDGAREVAEAIRYLADAISNHDSGT